MGKALFSICVALIVHLYSAVAEASHFRSGTINWKVPDPQGAPLTVEFRVQVAWRAAMPGTTNLQFGDGQQNGLVLGNQIGGGTDASGQAYLLYEYKVNHTYAAPGTYTAFFTGSARIVGLQNGSNGAYTVQTKLDLSPGNTGGPVSLAPAIIQMQIGGTRMYTLPAFDPDLDPITCRFATDMESGLPVGQTIPTVPGNGAQPILSGACTFTWDLSAAVVPQQYVIHLVMESTHNGVVSSTALDLIVEMTTVQPPSCSGTGSFVAEVGGPFSTSVLGTNPALGNLTITSQNQPMGSTLMPASGQSGPSPLAGTFSWTPTAADVGTTIVLVNYTSGQNISGACFLTIQVPQCANFGTACQAAGAVGECVNGSIVCTGLNMSTCAAGNPDPEACDLKDNDCDGAVDNSTLESGVACVSGLQGACAAGTTVCVMGNMNCVANIMPGDQMELCNEADDDCDGTIDNGFQTGQMCTTGLGECAGTGVFLCDVNGAQQCSAVASEPTSEICDNLDNNCDGVVDDNVPGAGAVCATGDPSVCATGMTACVAGMLECVNDVEPGANMEMCNTVDDDCNNVIDEGFNVGAMCSVGTGECEAPGFIICDGMGGATCDATPGSMSPEVCDLKDNDCDGVIDNQAAGTGQVCQTGLWGVCALGKTACTAAGAVECAPDVVPGSQSEQCDDELDSDCDGDQNNTCNTGSGGSSGSGSGGSSSTGSGGSLPEPPIKYDGCICMVRPMHPKHDNTWRHVVVIALGLPFIRRRSRPR